MSVRTRRAKRYLFNLLVFLLTAFFAVTIVSCKKKLKAEDENRPIILGFSQIGAESEWRIRNTESILEAAAESGIQILYENAQQKQENQLQAIHSFIIYQVDVIAFVPIVETGWDNVLQEAKEAGIPVIVVDRKIQTADKSLYAGLIGEDGYSEGQKAAEFLLKKFRRVDRVLNILELYGTENSSPAYERASGFRSIIKNEEKFKIIHSESGDFMRSKGHEIGRKIISFNGGLKIGQTPVDIIFSHNDAMTWGMLDAFSEYNINPSKVTIVTIDGERKSIQAIRDGSINCVVECNPNTGPKLCELVKMLKEGKSIPPVSYVEGAVYTEFDDYEIFEGKGF